MIGLISLLERCDDDALELGVVETFDTFDRGDPGGLMSFCDDLLSLFTLLIESFPELELLTFC